MFSPTARYSPIAKSINGIIYVVGGYTSRETGKMETFDPKIKVKGLENLLGYLASV
ncbi:hypothetical protein [uncultured Brevibacillus sp.]|uniref:hypothetical protein n=1 Tax=uncultured Brevibacillus sp. TaxID=169970 RepID=UPI00338FBE3B